MERYAIRRYFPTFVYGWSRLRVVRFHHIAAVLITVVVLTLDFAWVQRFVRSPWSLFGFEYFGMDLGVMGMANILLVGLYLMTVRPGRGGPFLVNFEVCGSLILLAFIGCGLRFPDITQLLSFWLFIPIIPLLYLSRLLPEDAGRVYALTLGFTFPQLLIASVCALMARYAKYGSSKPS